MTLQPLRLNLVTPSSQFTKGRTVGRGCPVQAVRFLSVDNSERVTKLRVLKADLCFYYHHVLENTIENNIKDKIFITLVDHCHYQPSLLLSGMLLKKVNSLKIHLKFHMSYCVQFLYTFGKQFQKQGRVYKFLLPRSCFIISFVKSSSHF